MGYYLAYGSNLNKKQMKYRYPDARPCGKTVIEDMRLVFRRGFLTIEESPGGKVPVGVWRISETDEAALDRYEGYPRFYQKMYIDVDYRGGIDTTIPCLVYIMNDGFPIQQPSKEYLETVMQGYRDFGMGECTELFDAWAEAIKEEGSEDTD